MLLRRRESTMQEQKSEKLNERVTWLNRVTYERANKETADWPQWKRDAFNQFYSMHSTVNSIIIR